MSGPFPQRNTPAQGRGLLFSNCAQLSVAANGSLDRLCVRSQFIGEFNRKLLASLRPNLIEEVAQNRTS